ncbi:MAG: hypothetical protein C5B49_01160 [Bdellovibrio sp.]|nr:MAG: hypothetical protein C5B49_01160 [Bdellovibrio sp.]
MPKYLKYLRVIFFRFLPLIVLACEGRAQTADKIADYDLEARGDQVCKVGSSYREPVCYSRSTEILGFPGSLPMSVDITKSVKAYLRAFPDQKMANVNLSERHIDASEVIDALGAALFLTPADRDLVSQHFRVLDVRNPAFDPQGMKPTPTGTIIPFVATLAWEGQDEGAAKDLPRPLNSMIHFEGDFFLPRDQRFSDGSEIKDSENIDEMFLRVGKGVARSFTIKHFNDFSTEQKAESLRPELARIAEFQLIKGKDVNVDAETLHLLQYVAGPAVFAEAAIGPAVREEFERQMARKRQENRENQK